MMTSSRPRDEAAGSFSSRRGHASQLSISDPSHHVTEAIGTLYGDEDDSGSENGGRPLSFIDGSSYREQIHRPAHLDSHHHAHARSRHQQQMDYDTREPLTRSTSDEPYGPQHSDEENGGSLEKSQTPNAPSPNRRASIQYEGGSKPPAPPTLSLRDAQADEVASQFPLTNIENPNDIAQELSNLQALRRMSMDVGNSSDPDIPPIGLSAMPVIAPSGNDDKNDPSRLLWVPARVHPELAPSEFKSFLENRVQSFKRRSGESFLSAEGNNLNFSNAGSLRRQKSMLSRQIDNSSGQGAVGYVDGADRLERKRSTAGRHNHILSPDELVEDAARAVQKFAKEAQSTPGGEEGGAEDMPILPMAPGMGLRRSTRTTYRKGGSLRSGDRLPFSKRLAQKQQDGELPDLPSVPPSDMLRGKTPENGQDFMGETYPRPPPSVRKQQDLLQDLLGKAGSSPSEEDSRVTSPPAQEQLHVRAVSMPTIASPSESEPRNEDAGRASSKLPGTFPQRSSSQTVGSLKFNSTPKAPELVVEDSLAPQSGRHSTPVTSNYTLQKPNQQAHYLSKPSQQPPYNDKLGLPSSSLLAGDASRTDNLTVIPTFNQVDKKSDKRSRKDRDDDTASTSSKSGSAWKWLKGVTDDKDKKKEESKRAKAKALTEKTSDNARLDVIQSSIDKTPAKGRESLVLDRDNIDSKLLEERRKESHRKSDSKKDKDGNIFSSIFGGSKRKEEREKSGKKSQHLQVPEGPVDKSPRPDVDYGWTRYTLGEERAIYRMAHIKLANPRRPLLSQVLLSNFMYSYLAIVQAMHPQMNVPTSPQQKRLEEEARRKRQEQEYLAPQQMDDEHADNSLEQYNFDYHRAAIQYAESGHESQIDYVDEAQIYEDEHGNDNQDDYGYDNQDGYGHSVKDYYQHQGNDSHHRRQGGDSMW
ncbi:Sporulation protein Zds1 [Metarhizium album ARSEF 1941]|uniref:Sporulation protein Zds1 n=1 Tax=Metarhizium album (strain ARSEF 1941) TaxID=1081103 RepID=A0A0B2WZK3_METAS|nr:Sporulation protein Zds1 [Metarhizium album ARSEF 1941]KHN99019.1 Sporulation protein Zds1 [Metarhizium album ARSEF 1941]